MKKLNLLLAACIICSITAPAQTSIISITKPATKLPASKVDFDAYENLVKEVKAYRKDRLLDLSTFMAYSKDSNTVILDTRSTEMYNRKHLKGAIHLDFTDFTQAALLKLIPSANTRILIYCNNNFSYDQINFATKAYVPRPQLTKIAFPEKSITLALNIPTYINLYGYGYKNVYELGDLVSVLFPQLYFEGTAVSK